MVQFRIGGLTSQAAGYDLRMLVFRDPKPQSLMPKPSSRGLGDRVLGVGCIELGSFRQQRGH